MRVMNVDLIKNTGIQFISVPCRLSEDMIKKVSCVFFDEVETNDSSSDDDVYSLKQPLYHEESDIYLRRETINQEAFDTYGEWVQERTNLDHAVHVDEDLVYTISGKESLELYEGDWCPIPFYHIKSNPRDKFHHGPESWARVLLEKTELNSQYYKEGYNYCITLAIDTKTEELSGNSVYKRPREIDAQDNGNERFRLTSEFSFIEKFYSNNVIDDWCWEVFTDAGKHLSYESGMRYTALHVSFLNLLSELGVLPEVRFLAGENELECSLTLDIGNSRTCGIIIEKNSPSDFSPFSFNNARRLQIRNLQKPSLLDDQPFEMQLAFKEELFGLEEKGFFKWPSLVRLGKEAVELTAENSSASSLSSMSSPKRYLWDKSGSKLPWMKITKKSKYDDPDSEGIRKYALYGFANRLNDQGKYIKNNVGSISQSSYSRSSLMMFSIYEVLLHAISQINSFEFRKEQGNTHFRRVLKDIVLTCPTAMTEQEQYDLRKAALDAKDLIQETLGNDIKLNDIRVSPKLPKLNNIEEEPFWKYDEATCSQLAYLYGEIVHKFKGRTNLFFELNGRFHNDADSNKTVNVASIDIGGGTTDLMITNYSNDKNASTSVISPDPLFWEGFNIAGDDIVKRIVETIFIPSIEGYLKDIKAYRPSDALNIVFGAQKGSASNKIYSRQIANQIATSFAYEAMEVAKGSQLVKVKLNEVFDKHNPPSEALVDHINNIINVECNLSSFNLLDVEFTLDPKYINKAVRSVIEIIFNQLTFLLSKFNADIILLSGRPSSLPVVNQVLIESFRVNPGKVIRMGDYRFGSWYPFSTPSGYLSDPKSTVCVGALIAHLNEQGRLPGMQIDMANLGKIGSTAKYIGIIRQSSGLIENKDLLLTPSEKEGEYFFYGQPINIGMRQVNSEKWTVSPIYMFDFKESTDKEKFLDKRYAYPLRVVVCRQESRGEFLDTKNIQISDAEGNPVEFKYFDFKFQTYSFSSSYWKDSGVFVVNIESK